MESNVRPFRRQNVPEQEAWGGFNAAEITDRPKPREWAVDAMVPFKDVTLLAGAPKTGKSLLLMQMLSSLALGMPWIERHCEQSKCLGIFPEDDGDELKRRHALIIVALTHQIMMSP